jgi:hypothetical protein|uniref:Uncharacterized protein n=1 Tax=viral metagenome TaxID=1070528 RepID=A0A6C0KSQ2_9ZZZZ
MESSFLKFFVNKTEEKICIDYVHFFNTTGKAPSLFSKKESEKQLAQKHMNLLLKMTQKYYFSS